MTVVIDGEISGSPFLSVNMLYSDTGLYVTNLDQTREGSASDTGLQRLVPDENRIEQISNFTTSRLASDNTNADILYAVDFAGIRKIDVPGGAVTPFSMDVDVPELNLSQPRIVAHDDANQRLLISDSDLDMIMALDTETGVRSRFIHNEVGTGKNLIYPKKLALYSDRLLEVDIASGDTQTILTVEDSIFPANTHMARG